MRELAYLNAGITIVLTDRRVVNEEGKVKSEKFFSENGLKEFVRFIDSSREHLINDVIYLIPKNKVSPLKWLSCITLHFQKTFTLT